MSMAKEENSKWLDQVVLMKDDRSKWGNKSRISLSVQGSEKIIEGAKGEALNIWGRVG